VLLVTPDRDAVILVVPAATPVAKPPADIVAAPVLELFQVTCVVMFAVELSEYVPIAVNCSVCPAVRLAGASGVTAIEVSVGAGTTVKVTGALVIPDRDAVILVVPTARPAAKPPPVMVATTVLELFQVTCVVMSAVELSEYVPVAVNCRGCPTVRLPGAAGVTAIKVSVTVGVGVGVGVGVVTTPTVTC